MFTKEEEPQIRIHLAETLRWIICQRLVPRVGGGRIAILEILSISLRVKDTIIHGESEGKTFYDIISNGEPYGMWTFDQHILKLFEEDSKSEKQKEL